MISRLTAAIAVACLGMASAAATPRQAASDSRTPVLVELIATQPVAGARIVALSEHVDYWDRLGWKDPFSAARSNDVYTPQLVVDGQNALAAIGAAAAREKPAIHLAWTAPERAELKITVPEAPALDRSWQRNALRIVVFVQNSKGVVVAVETIGMR